MGPYLERCWVEAPRPLSRGLPLHPSPPVAKCLCPRAPGSPRPHLSPSYSGVSGTTRRGRSPWATWEEGKLGDPDLGSTSLGRAGAVPTHPLPPTGAWDWDPRERGEGKRRPEPAQAPPAKDHPQNQDLGTAYTPGSGPGVPPPLLRLQGVTKGLPFLRESRTHGLQMATAHVSAQPPHSRGAKTPYPPQLSPGSPFSSLQGPAGAPGPEGRQGVKGKKVSEAASGVGGGQRAP